MHFFDVATIFDISILLRTQILLEHTMEGKMKLFMEYFTF